MRFCKVFFLFFATFAPCSMLVAKTVSIRGLEADVYMLAPNSGEIFEPDEKISALFDGDAKTSWVWPMINGRPFELNIKFRRAQLVEGIGFLPGNHANMGLFLASPKPLRIQVARRLAGNNELETNTGGFQFNYQKKTAKGISNVSIDSERAGEVCGISDDPLNLSYQLMFFSSVRGVSELGFIVEAHESKSGVGPHVSELYILTSSMAAGSDLIDVASEFVSVLRSENEYSPILKNIGAFEDLTSSRYRVLIGGSGAKVERYNEKNKARLRSVPKGWVKHSDSAVIDRNSVGRHYLKSAFGRYLNYRKNTFFGCFVPLWLDFNGSINILGGLDEDCSPGPVRNIYYVTPDSPFYSLRALVQIQGDGIVRSAHDVVGPVPLEGECFSSGIYSSDQNIKEVN